MRKDKDLPVILSVSWIWILIIFVTVVSITGNYKIAQTKLIENYYIFDTEYSIKNSLKLPIVELFEIQQIQVNVVKSKEKK